MNIVFRTLSYLRNVVYELCVFKKTSTLFYEATNFKTDLTGLIQLIESQTQSIDFSQK